MTRSVPPSVASRSDDEDARLAAVHASSLLDSGPEDRYDDLTRLAAAVCRVPIALLSVVDADRIYFKSRFGLAVRESPFPNSMCGRTVRSREFTVVPDALSDPEFARHPLVSAEPFVRFYAGAPLLAPGGHAIGTLCVLDRVPRTLDAEQQLALVLLARQVVELVERERTVRELRRAVETSTALSAHVVLCAWCKRVRIEGGGWDALERVLERELGAVVSHGICADCEGVHFAKPPTSGGAAS